MDPGELPRGFSYETKSENGEIRVRIKEIADKTAALKWIEDLSNVTLVTWRVNKTVRGDSTVNRFKQFLHCQHAKNKRLKGVRTSKSTDCPATMQITVHGDLVNNTGCSRVWPTEVIFRGTHNHPTKSASSLKYRDMSEATRQRLCTLFRQGHSASSALHCIKNELRLKYGDDYSMYACDGHYVPSLSIITKLYNKEVVPAVCDESGPEPFSDHDMARFEQLISRIKQGLLDSPELFQPALSHMLDNCDKFVATDDGLVAAMHTFADCSRLEAARRKPRLRGNTRRGVQIGVLPTALGRRRLTLCGKRKTPVGLQPGTAQSQKLVELSSHDYTTFGSLPALKCKSPDGSQSCVYANSSLGSKIKSEAVS